MTQDQNENTDAFLLEVAHERFDVTPGFGYFLYVLPAYFVAMADGDLADEEAATILKDGLGKDIMRSLPGETKEKFYEWMKRALNEVVVEHKPEDAKLLAVAIENELSRMRPDLAQRKRQQMYDSCMKVAQASGEDMMNMVSAEEQEMLKAIFGDQMTGTTQ